FNRSSFPQGFVFGSSSSAYQYEGAAFEGGKGPSIWDTYIHKYPGKILDGRNGDVAVDFYHQYKEDVELIKYLGLDAFKISISWPRILPRGKVSGGINQEGIAFYNNLIDKLLENGIQPYATIFHWDLPQFLEDEYTGFLSPLIIDDFRDYADLCFREFGDRVKHWVTVNEPFIFINGGYDGSLIGANLAPGRCSRCEKGNSASEPYVAAHHLLLCHSAAVELYRRKYRSEQGGEIGMAMSSPWVEPYSGDRLDVEAAHRALDFMYGWFLEPLVYGDYPETMRTQVGDRLPKFTAQQSKTIKGSFDFIGLNYFTGVYAQHLTSSDGGASDVGVRLSTDIDGVPMGDETGLVGYYVYPEGLYNLLVYTKEKYRNPSIFITEVGFGSLNNGSQEHYMKDFDRIDFYNRHLRAVQEAIWKKGVEVKGLFAWTLVDTFEWAIGYTVRYGFYYVDFEDGGLRRLPKASATWFRNSL
ncbi:hypothetical protein M569_09176, partial [Genlisea aurea]